MKVNQYSYFLNRKRYDVTTTQEDNRIEGKWYMISDDVFLAPNVLRRELTMSLSYWMPSYETADDLS